MTGAIPGNVTLFGSAVTVTGNSLLWACWRTPRVPLRYSYRHWNTWFAFTPCSRATRAIDAPGTNVASTIRRFSSGVLRNRFREGATDSTATVSLTRSSWDRKGHLSIRPKPDAYIVFHELVHSTGHASRLNRTFGAHFGDELNSKEELVAEMGAAYLCAIAGIAQ